MGALQRDLRSLETSLENSGMKLNLDKRKVVRFTCALYFPEEKKLKILFDYHQRTAKLGIINMVSNQGKYYIF